MAADAKTGLMRTPRRTATGWCWCLLLLGIAGCATRGLPPVADRSPQFGDRPLSYMVRAGDTLYSVAWRYRLDVAELARWNQLQAPFVLQIDQWLRLRAPTGAQRSRAPTAPPKTASSKPPTIAKQASVPEAQPAPAKSVSSVTAKLPPASSWRWPVTANAPGTLMRQTFDPEHPGIEFRVPVNDRAVAASAGRVVYAGAGLGGYEHLIIVRHANALLSAYSFDGTLAVAEGTVVKVGAALADISTVGRRGSSLYFELRRRGSPIDPRRIIR